MIGSRTRSREIALQILYCCDQVPSPAAAHWELTLEEAEASPEVKAFARELVDGVLAQRDEIDRHIAAAADNWDLRRLAAVDRNVLRLSVHELLSRRDIPAKVSINEAIELGKRFSTAQSGAFINGILDRIRRDLQLPVDGPPGEERDEGDEPAPDGQAPDVQRADVASAEVAPAEVAPTSARDADAPAPRAE